jgi:hypothetical protein
MISTLENLSSHGERSVSDISDDVSKVVCFESQWTNALVGQRRRMCRKHTRSIRKTCRRRSSPLPTVCLVVEPGEKVSTLRGVVVFSPDQIFVEYLVAYQRCRTHCFGKPMNERTVVKEGTKRGRKILRCAKECSFFQILPLC